VQDRLDARVPSADRHLVRHVSGGIGGVAVSGSIACGLLPGPGIGKVVVLVQDRFNVGISCAGWWIARRVRGVVTGLMILGGCVASGLLPSGGGVGRKGRLDVAVVVAGIHIGGT